MKTFKEIFDEVIPESEIRSLFGYSELEDKVRLIAETYALQVGEDLRERCAMNADNHMVKVQGIYSFDHTPVLTTEIILP